MGQPKARWLPRTGVMIRRATWGKPDFFPGRGCRPKPLGLGSVSGLAGAPKGSDKASAGSALGPRSPYGRAHAVYGQEHLPREQSPWRRTCKLSEIAERPCHSLPPWKGIATHIQRLVRGQNVESFKFAGTGDTAEPGSRGTGGTGSRGTARAKDCTDLQLLQILQESPRRDGQD